ncbi:MAG: hypothetical protein BWX55_00408 [Deltaproteobacteria bacterium ADurb.Bin022]|nr:MAG: hypothetical protein BWX55_00408 [Deltaproteobacteria bacterium ADurb.Bin022]
MPAGGIVEKSKIAGKVDFKIPFLHVLKNGPVFFLAPAQRFFRFFALRNVNPHTHHKRLPVVMQKIARKQIRCYRTVFGKNRHFKGDMACSLKFLELGQ